MTAPRRNDLNQNTYEERKIREAIEVVENMPPDERLTNVVVDLQSAFHRLADYNDDTLSPDDPLQENLVILKNIEKMLSVITEPTEPDWENIAYYELQRGEIIREGDWVEGPVSEWGIDGPDWRLAKPYEIGRRAPNPEDLSAKRFRRVEN